MKQKIKVMYGYHWSKAFSIEEIEMKMKKNVKGWKKPKLPGFPSHGVSSF